MNPQDSRYFYYAGLLLALYLVWRIYRIVRSRIERDRELRDQARREVEEFEREHGRRESPDRSGR